VGGVQPTTLNDDNNAIQQRDFQFIRFSWDV
jgi:hypothetical protein